MAFDAGINFRYEPSYVTDPAGCTYYSAYDGAYPITRGGLTFGRITSGWSQRDRNASNDPRIAGVHFATDTIGDPDKFRIDLPSAGAVDIYCALGDPSGGGQCYLEVFDNTTSLGIIVTDKAGGSNFYDAIDAGYSAAAWPASNAKVTKTFSTTTAIFQLSPGTTSGTKNYAIAHLRVVQAASGINLVGANSTEANTASGAAITQAHALAGSASAQANASSGAGIAQDHALAGTNSAQANTGSTGTVSQGLTLAGAASSQANTASAGAASQDHALSAGSSSQANTGSLGAITQDHALAITASSIGNTTDTGAITQGTVHDLTAASSIQANTGTTAAISQAHSLVCAPSIQDSIAAASAIVQEHILLAAAGIQANAAAAGAIGQTSGTPPVDGPAGSGPRLRIASGHRPAMRNTLRPRQLR